MGKQYQLWVQWTEQNEEAPQGRSDWTLYKKTDNVNEIFLAEFKLESDGNKTMVTVQVSLQVSISNV